MRILLIAALVLGLCLSPEIVSATPDISAAVLQQVDTTLDVPTPTPTPDNLYGLLQLLPWAAALIGAFLVKKWNVAKGKLDGISDALKVGLGIVATAVTAIVGDLLGQTLSGGMESWDLNFFTNIARGVLTVIAVTLGIKQAKEKAAAPVKSR